MPQRKENNLLLWSLDNLTTPVHSFAGHQDIPREFVWRCGNPASYEYQLVSIAKEQDLRLWKVDRQHIIACGTSKEDAAELLREGSPKTGGMLGLKAESPKTHFEVTPQNLAHEFSLVNRQIHNIVIEQTNAALRSCIVSAVSAKYDAIVRLRINFPSLYPNGAPPSFDFLPTSTVSVEVKKKLVESLTDAALSFVRHNRSCLEPCLRHLVTNLDQFLSEDLGSASDSDEEVPLNKDDNIPFPRTCGAYFGGSGRLLCFWSSSSQTYFREGVPRSLEELRRFSSLKQEIHGDFMDQNDLHSASSSSIIYRPRGMSYLTSPEALEPEFSGSSIDGLLSPVYDPTVDTVNIPRGSSRKLTHAAPSLINSLVVVKNISPLLPISQALAKQYTLLGPSLSAICSTNSLAAKEQGRSDLVKVWDLAAILMEESEGKEGWSRNPFRQKIVNSLFAHFQKTKDVQTLALLSCIFAESEFSATCIGNKIMKDFTKGEVELTTSPPQVYAGARALTEPVKRKVESTSLASTPSMATLRVPSPQPQRQRSTSTSNQKSDKMRLLEPKKRDLSNYYKLLYADILYRWGYLNEREEVLKFVDRIPPQHREVITFDNICQWCRRSIKSHYCRSCSRFAFSCTICHLAVKGNSMFCTACGHGGHVAHLKEWFAKGNKECPSGCRCRCAEHHFAEQ